MKKKNPNLIDITLMPELDQFAIFAFQTVNQKCYQFASYMNRVFGLDMSNIGCMELADFYTNPVQLPLFFYSDSENRETYQLVDISGNDLIKELKDYDKLLIMTGEISKRKALEIEQRFAEVEGVLFFHHFKFDDTIKDARKQEKLKLCFGSLILLLEEHRIQHKKQKEEILKSRQTLTCD